MYSKKWIRSGFCLGQFIGLLSCFRIGNGNFAVRKDDSDWLSGIQRKVINKVRDFLQSMMNSWDNSRDILVGLSSILGHNFNVCLSIQT